jgi:Fic family protein
MQDLFAKFAAVEQNGQSKLFAIMSRRNEVAPGGQYRHWDRLRHLKPPADLSHEEWWLSTKLARLSILKPLPLKDASGEEFTYGIPDEAQDTLHFIDQHAAGALAIPEPILTNDDAKRHYLVNSLIEEAIRSSQLEGAVTSRGVAKEMLRTGRPPTNRSERMILNNYRALEFMREEMEGTLTPDLVLQLHRILIEGTLENPDAAGRLQRPEDERVRVWDHRGNVVHEPPPAEQLPSRFESMCAFANGGLTNGFLHPVVRAILVHFWLGYDHPFEDGNGRTARALFYWSMRNAGYWLTEYLSISNILRRGPSKYMRAYMYTESDERDTTYFILYQLNVIRRAISEFQEYVERKVRDIREFESLIRPEDFNYRQVAILRNAVRHPEQRYTFDSHARSHHVSWQSARNDLLDLQHRRLLSRRRIGKKYWFMPVEDLAEKLGSKPKDLAELS